MDVLRLVIRNGFSRDMSRMLMNDLTETAARLAKHGGRPMDGDQAGFHH